ncbi:MULTISPECIES: HD domain-containing phosphohydrolase [unclassified Vibrio]|uniref:HD domain-containing phosphohydrolase n=1 Tax=Vibrio sp. HB236076 TaxID=3232307 RepID=A0AB39HEC5_9VIBR|nr:HD domain-containing phosphohydrolase [Vibrio sp. HB161653]MDP5252680.1 response regulator [Vibrio sp. HB161653]
MDKNALKQKLLIVDDEAVNLRILKITLEQDYQLMFAKSGQQALQIAQKETPDLILLDVMMPDMTGFETCQQLKQQSDLEHIPVIFVTALSDPDDETKGFDVGGVDYITKPISPAIVKARVKTHLSLVNVDQIKRTQLDIIHMLGRASEYKDNETGLHVKRMSEYSHLLALAAGWSEDEAEALLYAAPMHDIGKIGIPDAILQKPGPLSDEEFDIMRQHPIMGLHIIGETRSPLLQLAKVVARTHHEKFDGSGYPEGLVGSDIPQAGRITAIADVFDALTSKRPYKDAWPLEKAFALLNDQKGKHFDPELVDLFISQRDKVAQINQKWRD